MHKLTYLKIYSALNSSVAEMKLCTYELNGRRAVGVIVGEDVLLDVCTAAREVLRREIPNNMVDLLDNWRENKKILDSLLEDFDDKHLISISDVKLLAPLPRPRKIVAALVNTRGMLGGDLEKELKHPRLFLKAPNTVIGPGDVIKAPSYGIRPEVELALVIGRRITKAKKEEINDAIIGYTILNDVTAPAEAKEDYYYAYRRDPETGEIKKTRMRGPLFRSKNHDTFTPTGPWIVTADELNDTSNLEMKTIFEGETVQQGSTADYIFTPQEITQFITKFLTLEPGDIVSCGTVAWIGQSTGDPSEQILPKNTGTLELHIEKIGTLVNKVEPEAPGGV